jgi:hypothetical protein
MQTGIDFSGRQTSVHMFLEKFEILFCPSFFAQGFTVIVNIGVF